MYRRLNINQYSVKQGTYKVRNEIETKRNQRKRNEINEIKRNQRNQRKQIEIRC